MYIWSNEAWFASPALTLLHKGYLGTTILESQGTWLAGIERRTYWQPPAHLLFQAAWYRLFGFSLLTLRSISIAWGAATLLAWYLITLKLSQKPAIALTAIALAATDPRFLTFAALGRSDIMCAGLGSLGLAAYLHFRNRSLPRGVLAGHGLAAASCLTHPCGVLYAAGVALLTLYHDRRRIRARDLGFTVLPYAVAVSLWGTYILQAPSQFVAQFTGNISGIAGEFTSSTRWADIASPVRALKRELVLRYGFNFGWYETEFADRVPLFALAVYALGAAGCVFTRWIRNHAGYRALLLLGSLDYLMMAMFDGLKGSAYLVHTLPLGAALLAIYIHYIYDRAANNGATAKWRLRALVVVMACFSAVQVGGLLRDLLYQPTRWDYEAAAGFLRRAAAPSQIIAPGEFAFALGFESGMIDDLRLGYFSGRRPEVIVTNTIYKGWFQQSAVKYPQIHRYMKQLLNNEYRIGFHNSTYTVYRRAGTPF